MTLRNLTLCCQRHRGDRILDHSKSKLYFKLNGLLYEKNYIDETLESFFSQTTFLFVRENGYFNSVKNCFVLIKLNFVHALQTPVGYFYPMHLKIMFP